MAKQFLQLKLLTDPTGDHVGRRESCRLKMPLQVRIDAMERSKVRQPNFLRPLAVAMPMDPGSRLLRLLGPTPVPLRAGVIDDLRLPGDSKQITSRLGHPHRPGKTRIEELGDTAGMVLMGMREQQVPIDLWIERESALRPFVTRRPSLAIAIGRPAIHQDQTVATPHGRAAAPDLTSAAMEDDG